MSVDTRKYFHWDKQALIAECCKLAGRLEAAERELELAGMDKVLAVARMAEITRQQESFILSRSQRDIAGNGRFGIAVACDEDALSWQELEVEREELLGHQESADISRERLTINRLKAKEPTS